MIYTHEFCMSIPYKRPEKPFNTVVVCNTGEKHDSGYYCMKFILFDRDELVGCVGGYSDVIHLNGIGGYGDHENYIKAVKTRLVPVIDFSIDVCDFGVFRIFSSQHYFKLDDILTSDFCIYDGGLRK